MVREEHVQKFRFRNSASHAWKPMEGEDASVRRYIFHRWLSRSCHTGNDVPFDRAGHMMQATSCSKPATRGGGVKNLWNSVTETQVVCVHAKLFWPWVQFDYSFTCLTFICVYLLASGLLLLASSALLHVQAGASSSELTFFTSACVCLKRATLERPKYIWFRTCYEPNDTSFMMDGN